jgi:hypothetical protein
MERMEDLNATASAEFFAAIKGKNDPLSLSPEESKERIERFASLWEKESEMEKAVREQWALSAKAPEVYITF